MGSAEVGLRRADLLPPSRRQRRLACCGGDPRGSIAPGTGPAGAGGRGEGDGGLPG